MENSDNNTQPQAQPTQKVVKKKKVIVGGGYGYGGGYGGYGHGGYGGYSGAYGYGYGANYGGYGASYYGGGYGAKPVDNGGANGMPNRTFRDYMMILRERIWYIIVTFFVIFAGVLLYTFRMTPIYTSVATIQVLRDSDVPINGPGGVQQSRNEIILSTEDFNTQVKLMESMEVVSAVKSRLKEDEIKSLMNPFNDMITFGPKKTEEEILAQYRKVIPERLSLIVRIMFEHPDAQMAARITNLFATEYISYTHQVKVQKLMNSIDELRTKVSQQEAKVKELDKKLVEYRKEQGGVSLDQLDDVDRNELRDINSMGLGSRI